MNKCQCRLCERDALQMDFVYEKLPPDFTCIPVSYDEIKRRVKELE